MNALLGLPIGRVQRIGYISIHTILQLLISMAGGGAAALFSIFMIRLEWPNAIYTAAALGALIGLLVTAGLMVLYVATVLYTTSDERLQSGSK